MARSPGPRANSDAVERPRHGNHRPAPSRRGKRREPIRRQPTSGRPSCRQPTSGNDASACAGTASAADACACRLRDPPVPRCLAIDARADRARDPVPEGRRGIPDRREERHRPPDRRQRARAVRLVRPGAGDAAAVRAPAARVHRDPRHRHVVVAQAARRHRRGQRPHGAEARDPAPGLRHAARDARVRRARRPPTTARCASTPPRPTPTPPRATAWRACCSPTAGSAR